MERSIFNPAIARAMTVIVISYMGINLNHVCYALYVEDLPSLVSAGDKQYNAGENEDDRTPERRTHATPRNHPVSRLQATNRTPARPHH